MQYLESLTTLDIFLLFYNKPSRRYQYVKLFPLSGMNCGSFQIDVLSFKEEAYLDKLKHFLFQHLSMYFLHCHNIHMSS